MKFNFENGQWVQGEKPKAKTIKEWITENADLLIGCLIVMAVWWWFDGSERIFGDLIRELTPPRHLWR
jgi:hypothetical protein